MPRKVDKPDKYLYTIAMDKQVKKLIDWHHESAYIHEVLSAKAKKAAESKVLWKKAQMHRQTAYKLFDMARLLDREGIRYD